MLWSWRTCGSRIRLARQVNDGVNKVADETIRVLRIFSRLHIGGPSIHVVLLTAGLDRERYQTTLVVGREGDREGSFLDLAASKNVAPIVVPTLGRSIRPLRDLRSFVVLCRLMMRERPHVVHTHTAKAGALGRLAAFVTGVPVVVHTFHGSVFSGYFGALGSHIYKTAERFLARITDAIIGISPAVAEELVAHRLRPRHGIHTIPLGLELDGLIDATRSRPGALRRRLGLNQNVKLIGSVGRLAPVKDLQTLLSAVERVDDVHVALIGDGPERSRLEQLRDELGLASRLHFTGLLSELENVYPDLDCVVNSSRNEGTPVALIEAMAAGVPVVATAVGGTPDLLRGGALGTLVPPGDANALANALADALEDRDASFIRAAEARTAVVEKYRCERLIHDMETLYHELLVLKGIAAATPEFSPSRT